MENCCRRPMEEEEKPPRGGEDPAGPGEDGGGPGGAPPEPEGSLRPSQGLLKALQRLVSSGFTWGQDPPRKPPRQRWCWGPRPEGGAVWEPAGGPGGALEQLQLSR
ncbi:basic salivary proline-rich protein 3-like isoform X1 [Vidua chalybeata]|uniref:basic salivary proline-rich protein 3-like isoform X1 n=2 Tax=Vidua chalybeata TaxID=81927 RepID=UPI0023A8C03A|nr:basic salivary proline-rich protein 3-like isoform X1 [Vidua chalybeata]